LHNELNQFKDLLYRVLTDSYGSACAFEHGPNKEKSAVGCGVDHAHLHFVPTAFDLSIEVTPYLPVEVTWTPADLRNCQDAYRRGQDYLYFEQPTNKPGCIAVGQELGSQLFRRAIAAHLGIPERYNWREYTQLRNVLETIKVIRKWQDRNDPDCRSCFVAA
jgi:hypothetical protein